MVFVTTGATPKWIFGIAYTPDAIMRVTIGMNIPRVGYAPTSAYPPHAQCGEAPVARRAELDVVHLPAPVRHREQVLAPRLEPTHGATEPVREPRDHQLLGVHTALRPEPSADPRRAHAHRRRVHSEHACATSPCTPNTDWVDAHTVIDPSSEGTATHPLASIVTGATR